MQKAGSTLVRNLLASVGLVALVACQSGTLEPAIPVAADSGSVAVGSVEERLAFVGGLFRGGEQYQTFHRLEQIFPAQRIAASTRPFQFPQGEALSVPETYSFAGANKQSSAFLQETQTSALVVIQDGQLRYENYWLTGGKDVTWISFSVAKSFVSALIGIAIDDGLIESVETPITRYVPELAGSAYDGVRIKDVLQMSSGARWNEDYSDPDSDIMRYGAVWAGAGSGSFDEFTATLEREREPGTYNYYNSTDTQALAMLVSRATGMSLSAYAEQELWQPLGMESAGHWITDKTGVEMAAGGMLVTARDYAKLGQLFLQKGRWQGEQIVSADWVKDSLVADGAHLKASAHPDYPMGYGYQWWLPVSDVGEFAALGVYNQSIYVNPAKNLVIVKLSANADYGRTNDESSYREFETIALMRAIGEQL